MTSKIAGLVMAAVIVGGCGRTPTTPSPVEGVPGGPQGPQGPTVRLAVLVFGHKAERPLSGLEARVEGIPGTSKTGADGVVSFTVEAGQVYTVVVRERDRISGRVDGDVQWLMSLPE